MTPLDTLLKKPSVTIYLDGLMICCYDKHQKLFQAGIHTEAHFHAVTIKVKERGQSTDLQSLRLEHEEVKEIAPLFLYVEKKEGSEAPSGAATLYKPDDPRYRQAFANALDLQSESFHKHDHLRIKPNILAPLNILNGEFYSAKLDDVMRMNLEGDPNPLDLGFLATMIAGDISKTRGNLILRSKDHKAEPLINLPLSGEKHYEVSIVNGPTDSNDPDADPTHNHFSEYYKALVLKDSAVKYMVEIEEDPGSTPPDPHPIPHVLPEDPPCMVIWDSGISQLPDFN
ncbi:MAG TPA: hypothetical protein VFV58_00485 [Blastocatellia bacterium]|jgi:hypothetical protein|nr:hypothetical protein [Blastocatellia bacterium]